MHDPTVASTSTGPVFAGVDRASADHAVCVVDTAGALLWRHTVTHSRAGLTRLTGRLRELAVARVGIERGDGPVVEALLGAGLRVAVVPPRQVKNLRSRYTRASKDDRCDAYVLADGMRNQLRATLELAFPGAVGLFCDLHSPIARAFLRRFPTAAEAGVLDEESIAAWLAAEGYCGRTPAAVVLHRLRAAPAGLTGAEAAARRHVTLALLAGIDEIEAQAIELTRRIREALAQHSEAPIFTSLSRAERIRAAARLAEIGDARGRYPDAPTLAAAAGVCPYPPPRSITLWRKSP